MERQAPEGHHAGDRIVGPDNACPGQLVVEKTLGQEASEQAMHHPVFQVEVNYFAVECPRVTEHHWADGSFLTPLPALLPLLDGDAQRVKGVRPGGVGTHALVR